MGIIVWAVIGGVIGYLTNLVWPGDERWGLYGLIGSGIVGALLGAFLASAAISQDFLSAVTLEQAIGAALGAVAGVVIVRSIARNPSRGPIG